jgi:heme-binding protein
MNTNLVRIVLAVVIVLVGIKFILVNRSNPPVEKEIMASPEVKAILKRACYDCHSNETIWPWYSQVAPASWLLAWDVGEGREELNFSTWNRYSQKKRNKIIKEIWEEVEEGEMPPWFYLPLHLEARLSENDHSLLRARAMGVPAVSDDKDAT